MQESLENRLFLQNERRSSGFRNYDVEVDEYVLSCLQLIS